MPLGTLVLGFTLLQDPDGFRICKNACPVPSHKTPRAIEQLLQKPAGTGSFPAVPASPDESANDTSQSKNNAELGELVKKALLDTLTVQEAGAAKPEPPKSLTIYFPFNSATVSEEDERSIFKFIADQGDLAMGDPDGEHYLKLFVTGYTDSKGSRRYNEVLARRRAMAVRKVLKKREYNNVFVSAKGKCCYLDPTNPEDGKNRRAEIRAVKK